MSWEMHPKEFEQVLSLPAPARYDYFVKHVADWQVVWSLRSPSGWSLAATAEGREVIPVWPHERFAAACVDGAWEGDEPAAIALVDWLEKWLPGMERDGRLVTVFPTPTSSGVVLEPRSLCEDLNDELESIE